MQTFILIALLMLLLATLIRPFPRGPSSLRLRHLSAHVVSDQYAPLNSSSFKQIGGYGPLLASNARHLLPSASTPLPATLSPSSAAEFRSCPQSYLLRYILKLTPPPTPVMLKGTMCHKALEDLYDLAPSDRTRSNLHDLLRRAWSKEKNRTREKDMPPFFPDQGEEILWGRSALSLLDNYLGLEDPTILEPTKRETWVRKNITWSGGDFLVRGIVDRVDGGDTITDYKSGKSPTLKYSEAVNNRIKAEKFWQLKVYALLMSEQIDARHLRLVYLTSEGGTGEVMECDLGEGSAPGNPPPHTGELNCEIALLSHVQKQSDARNSLHPSTGASKDERDAQRDIVEEDLREVYEGIAELAKMDDTEVWKCCDRNFCDCHKAREVFVEGLSEERVA